MVVFCSTTTRSGVTRSAFDIELPNVAENIHGCFAQQNGIEKFHTLSPLGLIKFPNMGHDFIHLKMTCSTIFSRLDQVIQQDEGLFIYFFYLPCVTSVSLLFFLSINTFRVGTHTMSVELWLQTLPVLLCVCSKEIRALDPNFNNTCPGLLSIL